MRDQECSVLGLAVITVTSPILTLESSTNLQLETQHSLKTKLAVYTPFFSSSHLV